MKKNYAAYLERNRKDTKRAMRFLLLFIIIFMAVMIRVALGATIGL